MSAFTVHATLIHPDDRQRSAPLDLLVDTGAMYTMLPTDVVTRLALPTPEQRTVEFANGQRDVWPLGVGEPDTHFSKWPPVALPTPEQRTVEFANGQRDVWPLGEVRIRLADSDRTTVLLPAP